MISRLQQNVFVLLGISIPISIFFTNLLLVFLILLWILQGGIHKKLIVLKKKKWPIFLVALILFYFIGILWTETYDNLLWIFQKVSLLLLLPILVTSEFSIKTLEKGAGAFLITTFVSSLIAIFINFNFIEPLHEYFPIISKSKNAIYEISAFIKYNYHNILLSLSSLICIYLIVENKTRYPLVGLLFILVYTISIFTEAGRAGQLTYVIFLFLYAIYYLKTKTRISLFIFFFLLSILFFSYKNSSIFKYRVDHLNSIVQNKGVIDKIDNKKDIRYVFFSHSLKFIKKRPILGYGTGSFGTIFKNNVFSGHDYYVNTTPHNNYFYIIFELGIVGFMLFLLTFYYQIKELYFLKHGVHRVVLPLLYLFLMLVDSYLFIFIITSAYMYLYTIYSNYCK